METITGKRIKALRTVKGLRAEDVADAIEVRWNTIWRVENGVIKYPRVEQIVKLADFFNTSVDYLVGRTNDPTPPVRPRKSKRIVAPVIEDG